MANAQLEVEMSDHVKFGYSTLTADEQRQVDAWFNHLRNWRTDEYIKSNSQRLNLPEEVYILHTTDKYDLVYEVTADRIIIQAIYSKETVRIFQAAAAARAAG